MVVFETIALGSTCAFGSYVFGAVSYLSGAVARPPSWYGTGGEEATEPTDEQDSQTSVWVASLFGRGSGSREAFRGHQGTSLRRVPPPARGFRVEADPDHTYIEGGSAESRPVRSEPATVAAAPAKAKPSSLGSSASAGAPAEVIDTVVATFKLTAPLGISLNQSNVIVRIQEGGLAHNDGTLRVGDRLVSVNGQSCEGTAIAKLIKGAVDAKVVAHRKVALPEDMSSAHCEPAYYSYSYSSGDEDAARPLSSGPASASLAVASTRSIGLAEDRRKSQAWEPTQGPSGAFEDFVAAGAQFTRPTRMHQARPAGPLNRNPLKRRAAFVRQNRAPRTPQHTPRTKPTRTQGSARARQWRCSFDSRQATRGSRPYDQASVVWCASFGV